MMSLIVDFLLLAASGAACFYCFILNKKLVALNDTKDGLHTGVVSLSQSAQEMQNALASTKDMATQSAENLDLLLANADKMLPQLKLLLQEITSISTQAVTETEQATQNLVATLSPHIEDARASANLLLSTLALLDEKNENSSNTKTTPTPTPTSTDESDTGEDEDEGEHEFSITVETGEAA